MNDQERGREIIQAVYKASMQALFTIGVKSSDNIEKFTQAFSSAMDREFLKIGLFQPQEAQDSVPRAEGTPEPNLREAGFVQLKYDKGTYTIEALELKPLVTYHLKKAGITTIDELMTRMQQSALTEIKGIKEKSAKQILEGLASWQKGGNV